MTQKIGAKPSLFGLNRTNRNFTTKTNWGKNQFNTAFPAALACYMDYRGVKPVYLTLTSDMTLQHGNIAVRDLFGADPANIFFAFERDFIPYQQYILGKLPRVDLVTMRGENPLRGIEIKLTAIPDSTTHQLPEHKYGSELVVRPDTIAYLALSIVGKYSSTFLAGLFKSNRMPTINNWTDEREMLQKCSSLIAVLEAILLETVAKQEPLVMQPIWKTTGKLPKLAENCLDIFVWSNLGFTRLFVDTSKKKLANGASSIDRPMRTALWLVKMLYDYAFNGQFDPSWVIDNMTFNTKNDKAFAVNGQVTNGYMHSPELVSPRIKNSELKRIILNGGHKLLSPERRFDAIIFYSPYLFED
jgi:hypothetical protein